MLDSPGTISTCNITFKMFLSAFHHLSPYWGWHQCNDNLSIFEHLNTFAGELLAWESKSERLNRHNQGHIELDDDRPCALTCGKAKPCFTSSKSRGIIMVVWYIFHFCWYAPEIRENWVKCQLPGKLNFAEGGKYLLSITMVIPDYSNAMVLLVAW